MIIIDHVEVIEIAADFFGRLHTGIQIKLFSIRKGRKDRRKHALLYCRSHIELCLRGCEYVAVVVEYDAIHYDKRHQYCSVLRCVAERATKKKVHEDRE